MCRENPSGVTEIWKTDEESAGFFCIIYKGSQPGFILFKNEPNLDKRLLSSVCGEQWFLVKNISD